MKTTTPEHRAWVHEAIRLVDAEQNRSADTHLHVLSLPAAVRDAGIDLYLKDESVHPTGSLKHRLARSLVLHALCHGWIGPRTTLVEASSGSTAVSEAYFARLLGLPFVAVMPATTSAEKIALIELEGGRCHLVDDPGSIYEVSRRLAADCGGHYLDQFTFAERATDWRGNNTIAQSIFDQLAEERHPVPTWVVVGAGTGGTSATIGRYVRYRRHATRVCVADPEGSAYHAGWHDSDPAATGRGSRIEGIGRPRVEPSFVPGVVDDVVRVPDAASIAAARWCTAVTGRSAGGSTGTSLWAALGIVESMRAAGERGSVVTLLCDGGERYATTYYDDGWVADQGLDITPYAATLERYAATGEWSPPDVG